MEYNLIGVSKGLLNYNPIVINSTTKALSTIKPEVLKFTNKQIDYINGMLQNKEIYPVNFTDGNRVELYANSDLSMLEINIILNFGKEDEDNIILDTETTKKFLGLIPSDFNLDDMKSRLDLSKVIYTFNLEKFDLYITDFSNGVIHFIVEFKDKTITEGELTLNPDERQELLTNVYLNDDVFVIDSVNMTPTTLNVDTILAQNLTNCGFTVDIDGDNVYMLLFTDLYDLFELSVLKEISKDEIFKWAYGEDGIFNSDEYTIFRNLIMEKVKEDGNK